MKITRLIERLVARIGTLLARRRRSKIVRFLMHLLDAFRYRVENVDFDMTRNGEVTVMERLAVAGGTPCLFDVGANKGEWSIAALNAWPSASVHAFEVVPETFNLLRGTLGSRPNVRLNCVGLGSKSCLGKVYVAGNRYETATAFPISSEFSRTLECSFIRGDEYMVKNGIEAIDLLKIDVEGMELRVLKGFGERLRDVRCIQFEYGAFHIGSHDLLYDFFNYLRPFGFAVGKIYPDHVDFFEYHFVRENFMGNNYLAMKPDHPSFNLVRGG